MNHAVDSRTGLPLAAMEDRVIAYLIDFFIVFGGMIALGLFSFIVSTISVRLGDIYTAIGALAWIMGSAAYFIVGNGGKLGQTFGKHWLGIRVAGPTGQSIGYAGGLIRYIGTFIDTILCGIPVGLVWAFFDSERRTWHDFIGNTRVVVGPTPERSLRYWFENVRS